MDSLCRGTLPGRRRAHRGSRCVPNAPRARASKHDPACWPRVRPPPADDPWRAWQSGDISRHQLRLPEAAKLRNGRPVVSRCWNSAGPARGAECLGLGAASQPAASQRGRAAPVIPRRLCGSRPAKLRLSDRGPTTRLLWKAASCSRDTGFREPKRAPEREAASSSDNRKTLRARCASFDFVATYGSLGAGFAVCHHKRPPPTVFRETRMSDLAIVCSTAIGCCTDAHHF